MNPQTPAPENNQSQLNPANQPQQSLSQQVASESVTTNNVVSAVEQDLPVAINDAQAPQSQDLATTNQEQINTSSGANQGIVFSAASVRRLAIAVGILLVLSFLWYLSYQEMQKLNNISTEEDGVTITVSNEQEQGTVTITEQGTREIASPSDTGVVVSANATLIKTYYLNSKGNPNIANCSKVEMLEKQTERKYSSQIINTMRGLLEPLTAEQKSAGWSSAIPEGVLLKSVLIRDGGVAEANFTGNLGRVAGSCAVTAVRAQIEQTLKQFPGVKSVRICIDGNCNQSQILQP